jgi:hypothetical protein
MTSFRADRDAGFHNTVTPGDCGAGGFRRVEE